MQFDLTSAWFAWRLHPCDQDEDVLSGKQGWVRIVTSLSPATSSTSSTPRVYATNSMVPSPLGQMTLGTYSITTMGDYGTELDNSLQDYNIYLDADYPHMDLCS